MGKREDRREERQHQLLRSAMEILAEGGVGALTIPRLAKHMDASVGGLYRYFPSKEAIIVALQKRAIDAFSDLQASAIAEVERAGRSSPEPILRLARAIAAFDVLLDMAEEAPIEHTLLDTFLSAPQASLSDEKARDIDRHLRPVLERCRAELEGLADAGVLDPSDAMVKTHLMWAALHGLSHFRKRDRIQGPELQVRALSGPLIYALMRGWGAKPDDIASAMTLRRRAQSR